MTPREAARRALAAKAVGATVSKDTTDLKTDLKKHFKDTGTDRMTVTDDDGEKLGSVALEGGGKIATVADHAALLTWVQKNRPGCIQCAVDPDYLADVLAASKTAGVGVDPETGEIVPGVEVRDAEPSIVVRPSKTAYARMREILAAEGVWELER